MKGLLTVFVLIPLSLNSLFAKFEREIESCISTTTILEEKIDRKKFFDACLKEKDFRNLTKGNAAINVSHFFDYWEESNYKDKRWLAYILATVFRETQGTMLPIREGNSKTNEEAINAVKKLVYDRNLENKKNGKSVMKDYSLPDSNGNSYYGRGFVQLTGKDNYRKIGAILGLGDLLLDNPDTVLSLNISLKIAVEGSVEGWFARSKQNGNPYKLSTFFSSEKEDWVQARNIINPGTTLDRKKITAEIAKKFYQYLD